MSKNILILSNSDSGLYQLRNELIEQLIENNNVTLCMSDGGYKQHFINLGCKYIPIVFNRHGKNPIKDLQSLRCYKKIISDIKPDIVFTYTIKPNVYGGMACAALKIPYVVNITGLGTAVENEGLLQKLTLFLYKHGLRKAQKVFFQNSANRDFMLKHGVVKGKYDLLPGSGVNLERFAPLDYPADNDVQFVFIARIMREKGIDQYLEAAECIKNKYPNTVFHVCGSCEENYEGRLKELHEKGVIIYHGNVPDIREVLKTVHCTVHPTYYPEGLSNTLLESSACARPIITTDRPGCREVIDDGVNGYIVKKKDSEDLIEKIERFIALPWEEKRKMGLNGRKKVEKEFDRQIVVDAYLNEVNALSVPLSGKEGMSS